MFKTITAIFKVKEDTSFKKGEWDKDRSDFIFEVKRYKSGANPYGDKSGHSVTISNYPEYMGHYYDTRYDCIPTDKKNWVSYWMHHIEDLYGLTIELIAYTEGETDE